jgi:hypothetical protein
MAGSAADGALPSINQAASADQASQQHSALARAGDSSQHELEPNAIGLAQSTIMSIASSAPTASMTISLAALLALANTWFFRSQIRQGFRSFLLVAAIPLAAAAFLAWIIVKSLQGFTSGAIIALVITIALGVLALLAAQFLYKSPFFSIPRERYQPAPPAQ